MLCTRCLHAEAAPDGVLCAGCATPTGFAAPPAGGTPRIWLRSPVGLGRATAILLGLAAAVDVFALGADFLMYDVTGDLVGGGTGAAVLDRADLADKLTAAAGSVQLLVMLACAVVFVLWLWRVRRNAEVFAPDGHDKARAWVIAGWVVPIASLWYPRRVVVDIWDASSTGDRPAGHALINIWWTLWLLSQTIGRALYTPFDVADTPQEIHDSVTQTMVADGLDLVAAVLAAAVVLRLTRMQDEKARQGPAVPVAV
ncbi:hypothetical protein AQJ46_07215 [Streptomyces canus]|uniref:DUF4328 domain-containing protein n=1 Tax=Streptomyces canus TaxID=58343 RepID=A0A101SH38_9ACTN|nr:MULTISPECIES: DUF4328 domain-containing protein [Streptomyces]KUN73523.1 hypothetical protein AQJ46_07215 [Streptomyces canus]MDI5909828.1 DUF4328 domain-containing protein [Streptomyces sp. 12257]